MSAPSCSGPKWRCRVANFCQSVKRCGLGAVIAAAYQLTYDYDAGHRLGHEALRPHYSPATLIYLNDIKREARPILIAGCALLLGS